MRACQQSGSPHGLRPIKVPLIPAPTGRPRAFGLGLGLRTLLTSLFGDWSGLLNQEFAGLLTQDLKFAGLLTQDWGRFGLLSYTQCCLGAIVGCVSGVNSSAMFLRLLVFLVGVAQMPEFFSRLCADWAFCCDALARRAAASAAWAFAFTSLIAAAAAIDNLLVDVERRNTGHFRKLLQHLVHL